MHATPPTTRYFAPDRLSAAHTCAAMTRAASLPGEARLLPFVEILIGVEADHLLPPAPPRPDLAGETGQLLGSLEPLRRRAFEIRREVLPAGVRDLPHGVHGRVGLPSSNTCGAGRRRQICPQRLHDQPAAGAVERSRPPIGGRQHVAGQGDGNSGQGHDTHTQYYWIRSIYHFRWS